jgi:O-antigen ligase
MDLSKRYNADDIIWAGYAGMFFFLPVATSPTVISGLLVITAWIASGKFIKDIRVSRAYRITLPVVCLMLLPWIGLFYTPSFPDGLNLARKSYYWIYAFAIIPVLSVQKRPDLLIRIFLAGLSFNSAISILQYTGIVPLKKGLATGLLGGSSAHIAYSLLLTIGILIASFYYFQARSRKERSLFIVAMLQYFVTIGFTGGRSGYLALIFLSPFIVYNLIGQRSIWKIITVSIVVTAILFAFPVVRSRFAKVGEDIQMYRQGNVNTSVGLRFHMWGIAYTEIKAHPFFGTGTQGFKRSWEVHKKDPSLPYFDHPHNSFIFMMLSFGFPGLAAFCWLLFLMLKRGWERRNSAMGFSVVAFTAVFIIGSLTDTQVIPFATATAFPLFAGMSEAADRV